jgi:hypothetical protein
MKKVIIAVVIISIAIPFTGLAFGWNSFKFWTKPKVEKQIQIEQLDVAEKLSAEQKFKNWEKAFNAKNISLLKSNKNNFTISEAEINYFATKQLAREKNPPIQNLKIYFRQGKIMLTGYLLKPMKGTVEAHIIPKVSNNTIEPKLTKVRYRGMYLPKSIGNKIISGHTDEISEFLQTYPDYKGMSFVIKDGNLTLDYK